MKEFFTILFYGKVILLTPNPVNVENQLDVMLDEPIVAVTSGASVQIDVSSMIEVTNVIETRQAVSSRFPDECLSGALHGANIEVALQDMGTAISSDSVQLILSSDSGVPIGTEFSRIVIFSCVNMTNVEIYWRNYKK